MVQTRKFPQTIDTVLFDLDGTLLNTLDDLTDSVNFALEKMRYPHRTIEEIRAFVGNGVVKLIERAVPNGTSALDTDCTLAFFKEHYANHCEEKTRPYDGIIELLNTLRTAGYKIAVVSNKIDSAVVPLCKKYFGDRIQIAIGDRAGMARKPSPDAVYEAMHLLSSDQTRSVYIGDSDVDIQTAQNAGLALISVCWGFRSKEFLLKNGAGIVADKPQDILKLLGIRSEA